MAHLLLVRSMRTIFAGITLLVCSSFAHSAAAADASQFDGTWRREWAHTTPRGVRQVGSRTVAIRTTGISFELSELTLTRTISGMTKTLRIVQSCEAMKTEIKGGILTIHWSELNLLWPKPSDIPPGVQFRKDPVSCTYILRGKELLVTTGKDTDVFYRVEEERPTQPMKPL